MTTATSSLKRTPLDSLHRELGAKMVAFAGYDMPVQYSGGVLAEHVHTRSQAGLFDVSHMGQVRIAGADPAPLISGLGHKRKSSVSLGMSAFGGRAEVDFGRLNVCL